MPVAPMPTRMAPSAAPVWIGGGPAVDDWRENGRMFVAGLRRAPDCRARNPTDSRADRTTHEPPCECACDDASRHAFLRSRKAGEHHRKGEREGCDLECTHQGCPTLWFRTERLKLGLVRT